MAAQFQQYADQYKSMVPEKEINYDDDEVEEEELEDTSKSMPKLQQKVTSHGAGMGKEIQMVGSHGAGMGKEIQMVGSHGAGMGKEVLIHEQDYDDDDNYEDDEEIIDDIISDDPEGIKMNFSGEGAGMGDEIILNDGVD